jgi:hypothetical protein
VKVVITGADGQVGRALLEMAPEPSSVKGLSRRDLDITDADAVRASLEARAPRLGLQCGCVHRCRSCRSGRGSGTSGERGRRRAAGGCSHSDRLPRAADLDRLRLQRRAVTAVPAPTPPPVRSMCTA